MGSEAGQSSTPRATPKVRLLIVALVSIFVASSCMRVDLTVTVGEDGTADLEGVIAMNPGFYDRLNLGEDLADADFGSREAQCASFADDQQLDMAALGATAYDADGFCGVQFKTNLPVESVPAALGTDMTLRPEGDGWLFELPFTATDEVAATTDLVPPAELLSDAHYTVRIKLPGRQMDHNASHIAPDGSMVWVVDLLNPPDTLFARTVAGTPILGGGAKNEGFELPAVSAGNSKLILGAGLVLVAVAALIVIVKNRREREAIDDSNDIDNMKPYPPRPEPTMTEPAYEPEPDYEPAPAALAPGPTPLDTALNLVEDQGSFSAQGSATSTNPYAVQNTITFPQPTLDGPDPLAGISPATDAVTPHASSHRGASPLPGEATAPTWDPIRQKYVQWDPGAEQWWAFDDARQEWAPETVS